MRPAKTKRRNVNLTQENKPAPKRTCVTMSQKVVETRKNFITQEAHARHGAVRLDVLLANRGVVTTRRDILLLPSYIKIPLFP